MACSLSILRHIYHTMASSLSPAISPNTPNNKFWGLRFRFNQFMAFVKICSWFLRDLLKYTYFVIWKTCIGYISTMLGASLQFVLDQFSSILCTNIQHLERQTVLTVWSFCIIPLKTCFDFWSVIGGHVTQLAYLFLLYSILKFLLLKMAPHFFP